VLKFNPTSKLLVSGSADNTVRLIAIPEGLGDSCTFHPYTYLPGDQADCLPASWSYALAIIVALFLALFAVALQLLLRGKI
jgi:prolactin regulatory element-binding protein